MRQRALIAVLVLAAAAGVAVPVVLDMHRRPVQAVRVAGPFEHVTRVEIEEAIGEELSRGFFRVDVDAVRAAAMALPWVRDASVRRVWPGNVHITVVEREAIARWNDDALLESDGTLFAPRQLASTGSLPLLRGPAGTQLEVLAFYRRLSRAFEALAALPVRQVTLAPRGSWRAVLDGGIELVVGEAPSERRLERIARAFPRIFGDRLGDVERVDMRYASGIAVRWRAPDEQRQGG